MSRSSFRPVRRGNALETTLASVSRTSTLAPVFAALACTLLALCFGVPFLHGVPKEELVRTSLWGVAVLASAAGWGTELARRCWPGERVGLSLRVVWGASAYAFFGGLAAMVSGLSRLLVLGWLLGGAALLARSFITERDTIAREVIARLRAVRLHMPLAAVAAFLGVAVLLRYLGGTSDVSSNPFDDDVAYWPLAKQLFDRGTLIDPFSFRRMSTLGGQALYQAALLVRVPVLHINVFDRGMCFALSAGLLASHRTGGAKAPILARVVSVAFLVVLPNTSINGASYYSGLAFFLAFFQTLERLPSSSFLPARAAAVRLLPIALTGAALCTLRQNYQAVVALVLVFSYGLAALRARKEGVRPILVEGAVCLGLIGLFVLPWLVLLYRSSDTFLFPIMKGTFRAGVAVQSAKDGLMPFVRFFAEIWAHPDPITTLPLFMLVGLAVRETSARRPLAAQWLGGFFSIAMLVQAFSLSNAPDLARYDFGFATASALLTWHTVVAAAARRPRMSPFASAAPVALLAFALSAPLLETQAATPNGGRIKKTVLTPLRDLDEMLRRTVPTQLESPVAGAYHRLQAKVPERSRLVIMLDEPYFLDYARNEIWNLDMPAAASPAPGIPCFQGPEAVAKYFLAQGIRHVGFVLADRSAYLYRTDVWFEHLFGTEEIWRVYAPYMVDVMTNLAALAESRLRIHEEAGMVLLDLETRK